MKLVKGSAEAKRYMASIRTKKKISGNEQKQFYIEFLNKDKGFKKDIKYFNTFELAKNWALKTFDKFDIDVIKENNMKKLGNVKASKEIKKTLKAKKLYMPHGYATAKRKRKIGEVHTDTKSHNVKINVLSGTKPIFELIENLLDNRSKLKQYIVFNNKLGERYFFSKEEIAGFKKQIPLINKEIAQLKRIAKEQEKFNKLK